MVTPNAFIFKLWTSADFFTAFASIISENNEPNEPNGPNLFWPRVGHPPSLPNEGRDNPTAFGRRPHPRQQPLFTNFFPSTPEADDANVWKTTNRQTSTTYCLHQPPDSQQTQAHRYHRAVASFPMLATTFIRSAWARASCEPYNRGQYQS